MRAEGKRRTCSSALCPSPLKPDSHVAFLPWLLPPPWRLAVPHAARARPVSSARIAALPSPEQSAVRATRRSRPERSFVTAAAPPPAHPFGATKRVSPRRCHGPSLPSRSSRWSPWSPGNVSGAPAPSLPRLHNRNRRHPSPAVPAAVVHPTLAISHRPTPPCVSTIV